MNIDEPGEEHIIDEDIHGEFDENLLWDLVPDYIVDPDLNIDIPNMESATQGAGQQGPLRMVVLDPMRNLVHIDGMQATLNMAKRLMAVSKGPSPGASAISNIPFMVASNHDGLASGNYQKPDISKQVTFQDSALLSVLQKINKKLKSLDNDLYALRAERNERSRREYRSPGRQMFRNRSRSRDNSRESSRDSQDRDRRNSKRPNRSRNKSRNNSSDRSNDRARNGRNDSHTWKYCWEMQANAKKARRLKEMDDRDDDPSDTFSSMASEDPISDDDLDGFIRKISDMAELN